MGSVLAVIFAFFLIYLFLKITWWFVKFFTLIIASVLLIVMFGPEGLVFLIVIYFVLKKIFP